MATPSRETRADRLIRWFKDHPVFALLLVLMMGLTVVFKFFGEGASAFAKVWDAREKLNPPDPSDPPPPDTVYLPTAPEAVPSVVDPPPATRIGPPEKTAAAESARPVECLVLFPTSLVGAECRISPEPVALAVNMTRARAQLRRGTTYRIVLRGADGSRRVATVTGGTPTVTPRQFSAHE